MSRKPRKQYDDDDGRTIANMNVAGMPWYRPWKRESPDGMTPQTSSAGGKKRREPVKLTREESRAVTWGVLKAALLVASIYGGAILLFLLFCDFVLFK